MAERRGKKPQQIRVSVIGTPSIDGLEAVAVRLVKMLEGRQLELVATTTEASSMGTRLHSCAAPL